MDVRQELDLRIGSSFTRFMTMLLRSRIDFRSNPEQPLVRGDSAPARCSYYLFGSKGSGKRSCLLNVVKDYQDH